MVETSEYVLNPVAPSAEKNQVLSTKTMHLNRYSSWTSSFREDVTMDQLIKSTYRVMTTYLCRLTNSTDVDLLKDYLETGIRQ